MTDHYRELDHRVSDGIEVCLLWRKSDDRVLVAVTDVKTRAHFEIEVLPGERASHVFRHPYGYAAWRGIDTEGSAAEAMPNAA